MALLALIGKKTSYILRSTASSAKAPVVQAVASQRRQGTAAVSSSSSPSSSSAVRGSQRLSGSQDVYAEGVPHSYYETAAPAAGAAGALGEPAARQCSTPVSRAKAIGGTGSSRSREPSTPVCNSRASDNIVRRQGVRDSQSRLAPGSGGLHVPPKPSPSAVEPTLPAPPSGPTRKVERVTRGPTGLPWTLLHARLHRHVKVTNLLPRGASVLVAVSGGQDSVCLLRALADLQPLWGWRLGVVHCDHRWRSDSATNAAFVQQLASELDIPCHVLSAEEGTPRSEEAAREWRYNCITRVAREHGYGVAVTAHTATDRAETLLLNLLRGSGPDGLVALAESRVLRFRGSSSDPRVGEVSTCTCGEEGYPCVSGASGVGTGARGSCDRGSGRSSSSTSSNGGRSRVGGRGADGVLLVRPLLEFTREDTAAFCEALELDVYHDTTNDCLDMRRNRVRHELMPYLRHHFNPQLDGALFRFMEVLDADIRHVEARAEQAYAACRDLGQAGQQGAATVPGPQPRGEQASYRPGRGARSSGKRSRKGGVQEDVGPWRFGGLCQELLARLDVALQRRVVRLWLQDAVELQAVSRGADGGAWERGRQVGYEDVQRCLALVHAPNRTNSDSLCGGLVATVRGGWLRLRTAAEVAEEAARAREQRKGARGQPAVGRGELHDGQQLQGGAVEGRTEGAQRKGEREHRLRRADATSGERVVAAMYEDVEQVPAGTVSDGHVQDSGGVSDKLYASGLLTDQLGPMFGDDGQLLSALRLSGGASAGGSSSNSSNGARSAGVGASGGRAHGAAGGARRLRAARRPAKAGSAQLRIPGRRQLRGVKRWRA